MLDTLRRLAILLVMITASSASTAGLPMPMRFACSVKGAELVKPGMSADAICGQVKAGVDRALSVTSTNVAAAPDAARDKSGWVSVDVRITKAGVASATVTRAAGGQVITHPEMSIAVSDRPVDAGTIEMLVQAVIRVLV